MGVAPDVPTQVWVHPDVVVGMSSIAGHGLFATAPIAAGLAVVRLGGRIVATAELHQLFAEAPDGAYVDTFAIGDDAHLVLPGGTDAHYGNHSCAPTIWPNGAFELVARVDLAAGDELTVDYGTISDDPTFRMPCACGAGGCRRVVTGEDWRLAELQARYAGHWPPGLQRHIDLARSGG